MSSIIRFREKLGLAINNFRSFMTLFVTLVAGEQASLLLSPPHASAYMLS